MGTDEHDLTNAAMIGGSLTGFAALMGALRSPLTNWRFWVAGLAGLTAGGLTAGGFLLFAPGTTLAFVGVAVMVATFLATVGTETFLLPTPAEVVAKSNPRAGANLHARLAARPAHGGPIG